MIQTEIYNTMPDGTVLVRTYSDSGHYIIQDETGIEYSEAVDPEKMGRTYTESERVIEGFEAVPEKSEMMEEEEKVVPSQLPYEDAECVILHENEEEVCYNISSPKYPEYDTVDVRAV